MAAGALTIHYQRMSLEQLLTELLQAEFVVEQVVEPRPGSELQTREPERYAALHEAPCFLAVKLRRP
jgi:hypothetical protein